MIKNKNAKIIASIIFNAIIFSFTGCAQKVQVKAIQAGAVSDPAIKDIAVVPFENDNVSQGEQINSALSKVVIGEKPFFNVLDKKNLKTIMEEKKLNDSGLVDLIHQDKASTGLKEIRTLVTGEVTVDDLSISNYKSERTDYNSCIESAVKDGKSFCVKYRKYTIDCVSNLYSLSTNVKFIRVADSKEIFSNTFSRNQKQSKCLDQSNVLPSKREVNTKQAKDIANEIAKVVAPSYFTFFVDILDDEDVKFTSEQSKQLEVAIEILKANRFEKAKELFISLNNIVSSSTVKYNLGVTFEALGELYEAKELYKEAEDISLRKGKVLKEINESIFRVAKNIEEYEKAHKQIEEK